MKKKREPFTPTPDDLRLLSEHLLYEVQMTFYLAAVLGEARIPVLHQMSLNAQIEAFTIHVRQMIDFLWLDRSQSPESSDVYAADYFAPGEWAGLRPERPEILNAALRRKIGWGVAHLTHKRALSTESDKQWDFLGIGRALAPAVICFADNVDRGKLVPQHLDQFKSWAELVGV
jgi:hypothetical protein